MCGIVGIHFKNPRDTGIRHDKLENLVSELLLGIEHRGKDATGLLTVDAKGVPSLVKADTKASTFVAWRDPVPRRVRTILGHTRFATQGHPSNLDNDHPVQYGSCFAIHNGHISNDDELFKQFRLDRHAEVDSEIIPALFDMYGLDKAHLALQELDGNMATAVVDPARFPDVTVLAKGWSSPVEYLETKHAIVFASTTDAIQDACEKALGFRPARSKIKSLTAGELLYMEKDKVELLEFTPKVTRSYKTTTNYGTGYSSYSSGGYSYTPSTRAQGTDSRIYDECKSCGCKRLWHGNATSFDGACTNKIELQIGGHWLCKCEAFVQKEVEQRLAFEFCDGCGREFPMGDLVKMGRNYFCPTLCAANMAYEGGPTAEQVRRAAEEIIGAQVKAAEANDDDEWCQAAWDAREEELHKQAVILAADKVGLAAKFLAWLLFKAPIEVFESDESGYLDKAHKLGEGAYLELEQKLRSECTDIEIERWEAGDKIRPDLEEELLEAESCGVVVSIEEWSARTGTEVSL